MTTRRRMPDRTRLATWLGAVVLVVGLGWALVSQLDGIRDSIGRLDATTLVAAAGALSLGLVASVLAWQSLLGGLGSPLPLRTAARIFFVGQLGKYVPGSVWPVLVQMQLGKAVGVPRVRMAAASVMAVLLSLTAGVVAGLALGSDAPGLSVPPWVLAGVALAPVAVLLARPQLVTSALSLALRLVRRPPMAEQFTSAALRRALLWSFATTACNGVHVWLLARGLGAEGPHLLLVATGAFGLAMTAGVLVLFVPAGAVIREGALVVLLAGVLPRPGALALAVVSRLLVTVTDALAAGVALLGARGLADSGTPPLTAVPEGP